MNFQIRISTPLKRKTHYSEKKSSTSGKKVKIIEAKGYYLTGELIK